MMGKQLIYVPDYGAGALPDSVQVRDNGADETAVFTRVVRCADCRFLDRTRGNLVLMMGVRNFSCKRLRFQFPASEVDASFCSWGEPKEAGE